MPNTRLSNEVPNARLGGINPSARVSSFQTGRAGEPLNAAGTPIGLLLALTYAEDTPQGAYSDFRPTARVVTT